ncbi:caspase-3 [Paramuricea clavata]|uniref:Caspase-3 n=1 Tax=Paramuricea clavata TaxID=317549 RepID=A0A6S7KDD2_PARCT|nr:caspase-3 [Paramuricea clavata]
MARSMLNRQEICKVFVLVIVNEEFTSPYQRRFGAHRDRGNIMAFCKKYPNFTVNDISELKKFNDTTDGMQQNINTTELALTNDGKIKVDDLTAGEIENLFKAISEGDYRTYDAFMCFISSHGNLRGIVGADGNTFSVEDILGRLKTCPTLVGKPKLFFTHSCRGYMTATGVTPVCRGRVVADHGFPITIPMEADILVAFSSIDGYASYRDEEEGSWFITVLTKVLNEHAHEMNLTDMLAIVNELVSGMEYNSWKQMPCFMSTLRKVVYFKTESRETHPSSEELPTASGELH